MKAGIRSVIIVTFFQVTRRVSYLVSEQDKTSGLGTPPNRAQAQVLKKKKAGNVDKEPKNTTKLHSRSGSKLFTFLL